MGTIEIAGKQYDNISLIAFDKDGTLLSHGLYKIVTEKRVEFLKKHYNLSTDNVEEMIEFMGLTKETHEIIAGGAVHTEKREIIKKTIDYLRELNFNPSIEEISKIYEEADASVNLVDCVEPIDGVELKLKELKEKGFKMVVITHDGTELAKSKLECVGILDYFDLVLGIDEDSVYQPKPSPDMLIYACKKLELPIFESIVVGDDDKSMLVGKNAGGKLAVGVLTGVFEEKDFKHADVIINSIDEIKTVSNTEIA